MCGAGAELQDGGLCLASREPSLGEQENGAPHAVYDVLMVGMTGCLGICVCLFDLCFVRTAETKVRSSALPAS